MKTFNSEEFSNSLRSFLLTSDTVLYTIRVMFKFKNSDTINFKIITDTIDGIQKFINSVANLDEVVSLSYEYLSEFNCGLLGQVQFLFNMED